MPITVVMARNRTAVLQNCTENAAAKTVPEADSLSFVNVLRLRRYGTLANPLRPSRARAFNRGDREEKPQRSQRKPLLHTFLAAIESSRCSAALISAFERERGRANSHCLDRRAGPATQWCQADSSSHRGCSWCNVQLHLFAGATGRTARFPRSPRRFV